MTSFGRYTLNDLRRGFPLQVLEDLHVVAEFRSDDRVRRVIAPLHNNRRSHGPIEFVGRVLIKHNDPINHRELAQQGHTRRQRVYRASRALQASYRLVPVQRDHERSAGWNYRATVFKKGDVTTRGPFRSPRSSRATYLLPEISLFASSRSPGRIT